MLADPSASSTSAGQLGLMGFLWAEIRPSGVEVFAEEKETTEISTLARVPYELEVSMFHGLLLIFDCFLYPFTFLPLRGLMALVEVLTCVLRRKRLSSAAQLDLAQMAILGLCSWGLAQVDLSTWYHYVRVQSVMKLYMLFNLLEIFDKLFGSFGMDVLYSLYSTLQSNSGKALQMAPSRFLVALFYTFGHSIILFFQVVALSVAVNSENNVLLTLLISNQFVELKSSVFKKFSEHNLFQVFCHDVGERLQLSVYVVFIFCQRMSNMAEGFSWGAVWSEASYLFVVIVLAEAVVDCVKHTFITKFNRIPPTVYTYFRTIILNDLIVARRSNRYLDYSMVIARRMGFSTAPLSCLVIRLSTQHLHFVVYSWYVYIAIWLNLFLLKSIIGIVLLHLAAKNQKMLVRERANNAKERTSAPASTLAQMSNWRGRE